MKKLYRVTVEFEYIAYAEDEIEAEEWASDAIHDNRGDVFTTELTGSARNQEFVYHDGIDMTVASARELIAEEAVRTEPTAEELEASGQQRLFV